MMPVTIWFVIPQSKKPQAM